MRKQVYQRGIIRIYRVTECGCVCYELYVGKSLFTDCDTMGECLWIIRTMKRRTF